MRARPILPRLVLWGGSIAGVILAVLVLRLLSRPVREVAHLAELGPGFRRIEAPPFTVYSSLPEEESRLLADDLAGFIRAFLSESGPVRDFGLRPFRSEVRLDLFPDVERLQKYYRETSRRDYFNIGGFYDPSKRIIALPARDVLDAREGAYHEAIHLCFDVAPGMGLTEHSFWVGEGLATYFGHSSLTRDGWSFGGIEHDLLEEYRKARAQRRAPGISDVLEAGGIEFAGKDNVLYYALSHLIVSWLLDGEADRRKAFVSLVNHERVAGPGGLEALTSRLRVPRETLEREITNFIESLPSR